MHYLITYEIIARVEEDKAKELEAALTKTAKEFDAEVSVEETDRNEDDEEE